MKKLIIKMTILSYLMLLSIISNQLFAQPLPPQFSHGSNADQPAGAPLDGGLSILLLLGAAYGGKKVFGLKKVKEEEE